MSAAAVLPILSFTRKGEEFRSLAVSSDVLVGRGDDCAIRLDDKAVSRNHAVFRKTADGIEIEKKSEFAPILVNGVDCARKPLKHGDVIDIGPYRVKVTIPEPKKEEEGPRDGPISVSDVTNDPELESAEPGDGHTALLNVDFTQNAAKKVKRNDGPADIFSFDQKKSLKRQREENDATSSVAENTTASAPLGEEEPTRLQMKNIEAKLLVPNGFAAQAAYDLGDGLYTVGRGKGCDIVLLDKKSSRKNSEIRKDGVRYLIRDLDSANGTFVNGKPVKEQELYHDDLIRVGEAQIRFVALNKQYEKKKEQIENAPDGLHTSQIVVSLPSEESDSPHGSGGSSGSQSLAQGTGSFSVDGYGGGALGAPGGGYHPAGVQMEEGYVPPAYAPAEAPAAKAGPLALYFKYVRGFKDLKPIQKLIPILAAIAIAGWAFEDDIREQMDPGAAAAKNGQTAGKNGAPVKPGAPGRGAGTRSGPAGAGAGAPGAKSPSQGAMAGTGATGPGADGITKSYASLSADEKKYVDTQVQLADDAFKSMDYDKALFEAKKVYRVLPDFDRAKELERYSIAGKRRLEVKAEEKRKREEAERTKERVIAIVASAQTAMEKKDYPAAQALFDEIMTLDPENTKVSDWKKEIASVEEEKSRKAMEARVESEKNKLAWDTYEEAMKLYRAGEFHAAIPAFERVGDVRANDPKPTKKAAEMKRASEKAIRDARDPLLRRGKAAEADGNLAEAYRAYEKATKVDPPYPDGYAGMDRIRETLNARAKAIYIEGVMFESYSDFKQAFAKFNQILETAPEGSDYYQKAKRKLRAYQNFNPEEN